MTFTQYILEYQHFKNQVSTQNIRGMISWMSTASDFKEANIKVGTNTIIEIKCHILK